MGLRRSRASRARGAPLLLLAEYGQGGHKMIEINPVPGFQLVMLSFVGKNNCHCWFYIVDQLK